MTIQQAREMFRSERTIYGSRLAWVNYNRRVDRIRHQQRRNRTAV